jgi:pimeloyl-ACP methyl ester carboxylesterase
MKLLHYRAPGRSRPPALLVMLPGVGIEPDEFAAHGFIDAVRERSHIDVAAAGPDVDLYLDGAIVAALRQAVVVPALAEGYRRIWFLGLSLGGMGALLLARRHAADIAGIVLLAPFLGTPGMVAEVVRAGGLAAWQPGAIAPNDGERQMLAWLKQHVAASRPPVLHLGYGRDDRFAAGHAMLAAALPAARVHVSDGGHDWPAWTRQWRQILATDPFAPAKPEPA